MSCDGNRHKFWKHLTGGKNPFTALLGGSAEAAQQTMERLYQRGKAEAERLTRNGKLRDVDKAVATTLTKRLFNRMRAVGIKPPTHSKDGLPKMSSRFGYAAVYRTLAAIESGQHLPPDARQIVQTLRSTGSSKTSKIQSLSKATASPGLSAVGFDAKGYYRCANCGRFASQVNGHVCPFTANEGELSRMLSRRLGLPPSAWEGYRNQALTQVLTQAREQGVVTMVHDLTGMQVDVTLDGIPQAMMSGYIPQEWVGDTVLIEQDGHFYSVVNGEGLSLASDPAGVVAQAAQKYGVRIPTNAPVLQAANVKTAMQQPATPGPGALALSGGQEYDLGHFIGTEFRKRDARGTFIEAGGQQYGVYARTRNLADKSSARGRFAPDVDAIVVGRTLPAAVEILRTGSISVTPEGVVLVHDANGSLLAVYDPHTRTAGDMAGTPNASPAQMAAILAHRMQNPTTAMDYSLIQDFTAFSQGHGSPIAAADSAYLALRVWFENSEETLHLGAQVAQGGIKKCPQCGRFIGSQPHTCPDETAGAEAQPPAPIAAQETPAAPLPPQPTPAQITAPVVNVTVAMPDDFATQMRDAMRDLLSNVVPPAQPTTTTPNHDPDMAALLTRLTDVLTAQQQAIEQLQQASMNATSSVAASPVDIQAMGVAIGQAVARSIPAPQIVTSGEGGAMAVPARPRKCPKCGQYLNEGHTCPPRVDRQGLQRPSGLPPTETEKILNGITLDAPDLYLDSVPSDWGGQRAVPLPENLPELDAEYQMGQQERAIFNIIASQLRKKSRKPTNRSFGLYGPAGTGKNTIARQLAASLKTTDGKQGLPYYEINVTPDMDIAQAIGEVVLTTDENGATVSRVRLGPLGLMAASGGVAAVNEIVRSPKLATALQSIIEDGEISIPTPEGGTYKIPVHPSAIFITTWNPGYEGDADRPAQAPLSRMMTFRMDYPSKKELVGRVKAYLKEQNLPVPDEPVLTAGADFFSELRVLTGGTGQEPQIGTYSPTPTTPGPRELNRFIELGTTLGWDAALKTLDIICDQSEEQFPVQRQIIEERFAAVFGDLA